MTVANGAIRCNDSTLLRVCKNAYQNPILIRNGFWINGLEFGFDRDFKRIRHSQHGRASHSTVFELGLGGLFIGHGRGCATSRP
jgi:hypothetical protein